MRDAAEDGTASLGISPSDLAITAGTVFGRAMLPVVVFHCASANGMEQTAISRSR